MLFLDDYGNQEDAVQIQSFHDYLIIEAPFNIHHIDQIFARSIRRNSYVFEEYCEFDIIRYNLKIIYMINDFLPKVLSGLVWQYADGTYNLKRINDHFRVKKIKYIQEKELESGRQSLVEIPEKYPIKLSGTTNINQPVRFSRRKKN